MAPNKPTPKSAPARVLLPGRQPSELVLTFAGNIVKHLGVQMYSGRPVPAIAELISNAWDADATDVKVNLPLDEEWDPGEESQIIEVMDNGNGMTWDMVRDAYLDVGRDRREVERTDKSPKGRLLQGRKGLGKLAGFGIADILEVQTIHEEPDSSVHERALIWFRLNLDDLKKEQHKPAPADVIYAGPVSKAPAGSRKLKGTTITLRRLHPRKALNADRFHHSMAQRFLLIGPKFRVRINGDDLRQESYKLQWRWPKAGWLTDEVPGCGPVQYWIGFTPQPRKQNEGELSGILIYTRRKVSQEATFFEISGGTTGQHGLRYMVGMVKAEWVDAGRDAPDLIATHRGSIAWESPQGAAFQEWGQQIVRKYLAEWAKLRTEVRVKQIKEVTPALAARIDALAPSYKDVALRFVDKFKSVEMEPEEFEDILSWFLDALENATLRSILQKLRQTDVTDLKELDALLDKMEIRTAVTLLQIIESNLEAIATLERMHLEDAKERGVISKHLETNPWLMDPTWMLSKAEARVSTWIEKEFGLKKRKKQLGDDDRADFFCLAVGGTLHIVEIKRGGYTAKSSDIEQAEKYRKYVIKRFEEPSDSKAIKYGHVQSHLIAAKLHKDAHSIRVAYANQGWVFFTNWSDLIERARLSHQQFQIALKKRAAEIKETAGSHDSSTSGATKPSESDENRSSQHRNARPKKKARKR